MISMNSAHGKEKRKHPRVEVKWPVTMMTNDGDANGIVENISSGGAYIRTRKLLSNNDLIVMGVLGLKRELLWIGAEVVRISNWKFFSVKAVCGDILSVS